MTGASLQDRATYEPSRSVSALRVGIAGAAALALAGCGSPTRRPPPSDDAPVPADMNDKILRIAGREGFDGAMARVVLADGKATVREVKTWLAESDVAEGGGK